MGEKVGENQIFVFKWISKCPQISLFIEKQTEIIIVKLNQDLFPTMSSSSALVRVKEGAVVCGVCKGLEVSGRGSANG